MLYTNTLKLEGALSNVAVSSFSAISPPVAIGGMGGSGTRLVAMLLSELGYDLGDDLNSAEDNLFFTFLFKRPELFNRPELLSRSLSVFIASMEGRQLSLQDQCWIKGLAGHCCAEFDLAWGRKRCCNMLNSSKKLPKNGGFWGWKEPNTHFHLPFLLQAMPKMKYIHVMRNGLDMAFSMNQRQLAIWGRLFSLDFNGAITPFNLLRFWCVIHQRILFIKEQVPDRVMLLNYDDLCASPEDEVHRIELFLGFQLSQPLLERLVDCISTPNTIKRYKSHDLSQFLLQDIIFVESMGFQVS